MIRKSWGTRAAAIAVATVIACSGAGQAAAAVATAQAPDLKGHWAQETLTRWLEAGRIKGFEDGTVRPNRAATRAELIALVNSSFSLTGGEDIGFKDVSSKQWFYDALRIAVGNGYIAGYSDNTFRPAQDITREELAVILARLLRLDQAEPEAADANELSAWSRGGVGAVIRSGYMTVDAHGKFRPKDKATRAEVVVVLDRVSAAREKTTTYDVAGVYGPEQGEQTIKGNVALTADGITLRNLRIVGNLDLTAAIGEGNVHLDNVTVEGTTTVEGGGPNSVHLLDDSLGSIIVRKSGGNVRIAAEGKTTVGYVSLMSGVILSEDEALTGTGFGNVEIASGAANGSVVKLSGQYDSVEVAAPGIALEFSAASAKTVAIAAEGEGARIALPAGSTIESLQANGKIAVTGEGEIGQAALHAAGSSLEKQPGKLELGNGISASVAGQTLTGTGTGEAGSGLGSNGSSGVSGGGESGGSNGSGGAGETNGGGTGDSDGGDGGDSDSNPIGLLSANEIFSAAQSVTAGALVSLNAAPSSGTVVWFAPAGTETFEESSTMTRLTGNGTENRLVAPSQAGSYKMFVLQTGGSRIGEASSAALTVTGQLSGAVAGDLFTAGRTVQGGANVTLTKAADSGYSAWFAPSGTTAFEQGSAMTAASQGAASLQAPAAEGEYRLFLVDGSGNVSSASAASLIVDNTPPGNTLLAENVSMKGDSELTIGTLPAGIASTWLAPAGTTEFAIGATMTQTTGAVAKTPKAEGSYKLYLFDEAGNLSAPSTGTLRVDNTAPVEQNAVFSSNLTVRPGETVQLGSLPDGVTAWFAPAVATTFTEGATMTRSHDGVIQAPASAAPYKLILIDEAGNVSKPSAATLTVSP